MSKRAVHYAAVVFGLYALGVLVGFVAAERAPNGKRSFPERVREYRLQAFARFPLRLVGEALVSDDLPRTAVLMTVVNLNGSILHLLIGALYLAPAFAVMQGFLLGTLLSLTRSARTLLLTASVLPFEAGAFALSAGLGLHFADSWLLKRRALPEALTKHWSELRIGLPVVALLQGIGGFLEAAGAIWLRLPGVLTREEIARAVSASPS